MNKEATDLHQKIARCHRSLLAVSHPDIVKKLEQMIKDAQLRLDAIEEVTRQKETVPS
jgi:hypothetical protein